MSDTEWWFACNLTPPRLLYFHTCMIQSTRATIMIIPLCKYMQLQETSLLAPYGKTLLTWKKPSALTLAVLTTPELGSQVDKRSTPI